MDRKQIVEWSRGGSRDALRLRSFVWTQDLRSEICGLLRPFLSKASRLHSVLRTSFRLMIWINVFFAILIITHRAIIGEASI